jgi:hypothetical protein
MYELLEAKDEGEWLREVVSSKSIAQAMDNLTTRSWHNFVLLIDRTDESWDGSDASVILLMALMHACIELVSSLDFVRPLLFLRENVFDRVRMIDPESTRLETCVVSMEWTHELLREMIERRLSAPFGTKLQLHGPTWNYFFEQTPSDDSEALIFQYCEKRPRDILLYCSYAVELAQSKRHTKVTIADILEARRRFSETRLKDLGDEYAENYPMISLILSRFYGLGREFTLTGIEALIKKLLGSEDVRRHCSAWIYDYSQPELFIRLLYNIGFLGIKQTSSTQFRPVGPSASYPPALAPDTHVVVHPSYAETLDLRDAVVSDIAEDHAWQQVGLLIDIPSTIDLEEYSSTLSELMDRVKTIPEGMDHSEQWEEIVGDVIKLCFFRWLTNIEPKVRDVDRRIVRDWIVANRANTGFWEMVRYRYGATQVVWECKNYSTLKADDFQQVSYYMNEKIGKFVVMVFRGEVKKHYYQHVRRIASDHDGIVLLLSEKDLLVFIRQALHGKVTENHIQDKYDHTVREIS